MQNLELFKNSFIQKVASFVDVVAKKLPDDVLVRLKEMQQKESEERAKAVYDCIFENLDKAVTLNRPICQDTGVVQFFVKVGTGFPLINELEP
ncbi:MAG: fumarate hydratase, partial [Clostridia bacterium]|nr:fumarate hydratase [Clostridia bacterium]